MRRLVAHACLIGLLAAIVPVGHVRAESAKPTPKKVEARARYESGIRKFDLGKYDEAADDFEAAYELVGEPAILYNVAQAYRLGERFEKSAQFYRSFLRHMGDVPNRAEIEGRIIEMEERAANQRRIAERKEAERREAARKADRPTSLPYTQPGTQPGQQGGGDKSSDPNDPVRSAGRGLKILGYTLCVLSAASLGGGIAMSVLAGQASDSVERAASGMAVFSTELSDTESRGRLYDTVSYVMYAVAGAAAIGGAVSIYFGFRAQKNAFYESTTPVSQRPRRRSPLEFTLVGPQVGPGSAGLVLGGRF